MISGGFSVKTGILTDRDNVDIARPTLDFYTYGLDEKLDEIIPIFKTLLDADGPDFNPERIKTVLNEAYSNANGGIVGVGHQYSMAYSHSNVTAYGKLNETLSGLTAIKTMKKAVEENDFDSLSNELKELHAKIWYG